VVFSRSCCLKTDFLPSAHFTKSAGYSAVFSKELRGRVRSGNETAADLPGKPLIAWTLYLAPKVVQKRIFAGRRAATARGGLETDLTLLEMPKNSNRSEEKAIKSKCTKSPRAATGLPFHGAQTALAD
jgi:hypothetical protein